MNLAELADAVVAQRLERMTDNGPPLRGLGTLRFQMHGSVLLVGAEQVRQGKAHEVVERVIRHARERWYAIHWTIISDHDDSQLSAALQQQGFTVRETLKLMGCVGALRPAQYPTPGVTVTPITTIEQMQEYERISSWGFNHLPNPSYDHVVLRGRERWDEQQARWYQYYLGLLDGQPAGGAYVSLWERVPTIYGVVTSPPARSRGVAGQVMRQLVSDTLAHGYPWSCLYVALGNPAENLYVSLGYTALRQLTTYEWGEARW